MFVFSRRAIQGKLDLLEEVLFRYDVAGERVGGMAEPEDEAAATQWGRRSRPIVSRHGTAEAGANSRARLRPRADSRSANHLYTPPAFTTRFDDLATPT